MGRSANADRVAGRIILFVRQNETRNRAHHAFRRSYLLSLFSEPVVLASLLSTTQLVKTKGAMKAAFHFKNMKYTPAKATTTKARLQVKTLRTLGPSSAPSCLNCGFDNLFVFLFGHSILPVGATRELNLNWR